MDNHKALVFTKQQLKDFSESYSIDAQVFLMDILKINKTELLTKDIDLSDDQLKKLNLYIEKRKKHEPVAYIINKVEFMGLDFYVDSNTLIPRPDTEVLVEKVLDITKKNNYSNFLEIGIGSGCISISLAKLGSLTGVGVDIMDNCITIATNNAISNEVSEKIFFKNSDLFNKISEKYDIIVSNPPYINKKDMEGLLPNVKNYEPHTALFGGDDGLYFYREIVNTAKNYLNPKGLLAFEIGYDQGQAVSEMMISQGFKSVEIFKDLYKQDRVVIGFNL